MKCPVCKTADLPASGRDSAEAGCCPQCSGGWLGLGVPAHLRKAAYGNPTPYNHHKKYRYLLK